MSDKKVKRICIYPILSSGHVNVCITVAKILLNNYSDQVEVIFVVDDIWKPKIAKYDDRFKFEVYVYGKEVNSEEHMIEFLEKLEPVTRMPLVERMGVLWGSIKTEREKFIEIEKKCIDIFLKLKPDLILMDQILLLPSVIKANVPYGFIISCNPLLLDISDKYPFMGSNAGIKDEEAIRKFRDGFAPHYQSHLDYSKEIFKLTGVELDSSLVTHKPLGKHFNIYCFPKEIDYFSDDEKKENHLISFDTPLIPERLPTKLFELPDHFKESKIVYISLGSLFSAYEYLVQRVIDILAKLPYKYIVSKGANGDKLKFPNENFIGQNYVDQLSVLRVADAMVAHGGNNTLGECFYYGVPCLILPVFADQINNGKRIEETGFGFTFPIHEYTDDQLINSVEKLLHDESIRMKWKEASKRIQKEANYDEVAKYIFDYV